MHEIDIGDVSDNMYLDVITKNRQPVDLVFRFTGFFMPVIPLVERILYKKIYTIVYTQQYKNIKKSMDFVDFCVKTPDILASN